MGSENRNLEAQLPNNSNGAIRAYQILHRIATFKDELESDTQIQY